MYSVVTMEAPNIRAAADLESFITEEKKSTVNFGDALSAFCLIQDPNDARRTYFVWTAHLITCDAWSLGLVSRKLRRAYADFNSAPTEELKPKQLVQYVYVQSLDRTTIHDYWRAHYAGLMTKPLFPRPAVRSWIPGLELALRINLSLNTTEKRSLFKVPAITALAWALTLSRHF